MKGSYMRVIRGAIRKGLKKYLWRFFSLEVCDQVFHERRSANREMEKYLCGHFVQAARNGRLTETEIFIKNFFSPPRPLKPQLSCCVFTERHSIYKSLPPLCSFCRKYLLSFFSVGVIQDFFQEGGNFIKRFIPALIDNYQQLEHKKCQIYKAAQI